MDHGSIPVRHDSLIILLSDLNTYTDTFTQTHMHTYILVYKRKKINQAMKIFL